jgi:hypothetical protein
MLGASLRDASTSVAVRQHRRRDTDAQDKPNGTAIMPDSASSIVAIKTAFLAAQVKLLNRPLQLVDHASFAQTIPARELKNALKEGRHPLIVRNHLTSIANRLLRRHNKSIYHQLAIRSVAEQIDTLYWDADATEEDANNDGAGVRIDDDLTSSP